MRISCPVINAIPRISQEDVVLSGTFIPKGSTIAVDIYNIHHSSKVWKDSSKFEPDRFAKNGEAESLSESLSWVPFGTGPRQCIGMNFALAEQRVLLSMMCKFVWGEEG